MGQYFRYILKTFISGTNCTFSSCLAVKDTKLNCAIGRRKERLVRETIAHVAYFLPRKD